MTDMQLSKLQDIVNRLDSVLIPSGLIPTTGATIFNCTAELKQLIIDEVHSRKAPDEQKNEPEEIEITTEESEEAK